MARFRIDGHESPATERDLILERGACVGSDSALFLSYDRADREAAVTFCGTCAVQAECLAYARRTRPWVGVWGGVVFPEKRNKRDRRTPP